MHRRILPGQIFLLMVDIRRNNLLGGAARQRGTHMDRQDKQDCCSTEKSFDRIIEDKIISLAGGIYEWGGFRQDYGAVGRTGSETCLTVNQHSDLSRRSRQTKADAEKDRFGDLSYRGGGIYLDV